MRLPPVFRTATATSPIPITALALVVGLFVGCNTSDIPPPSDDRADQKDPNGASATKKQSLGESTEAYSFDGPASSSIPAYHERLAVHLLNRMRMDPVKFGLKGPMGGQIPPARPFLTDPAMIEAGRWQGNHAINRNCYCPQTSMEMPPPDELKNSCCTMARKKGKVVCTSPTVECDSPKATEEDRRWSLLGTGTANISNEFYVNQQLSPDQAPPAFPGDVLAAIIAGSPTYFTRDNNNAFAVSQVVQPKPPEECLPPEDPCMVGTCTNPSNDNTTCDEEENPECTGVCKGEACGGICEETDSETGEKEPVECTLPTPPDSDECKPSNYPKAFYISYLQGTTSEPIPTLLNGLHWKLGYTQFQMERLDTFGTTSADKIGFGIHYYEPTGEAQSANLIVDGQCETMQVTKRNVQFQTTGHDAGSTSGGTTTGSLFDASSSDTTSYDSSTTDGSTTGRTSGSSDTSSTSDTSGGGDAGSAGGYYGLRYGKEVALDPGCHRYVFIFRDANGFVHSYPTYGSLGAKVQMASTGDGDMIPIVVQNDDSCPVWSTERPDTSCLPEGDQCSSGRTRPCYTGRANTRGKGVCQLGTEECKNGRWSGVCKDEVTPQADEVCGDGKDNDCNGFVDEGCASGDTGSSDDTGVPDDTGAPDTGSSEDTGTVENDTGTSEDTGTGTDDAGSLDDTGSGVQTTDGDDDSDSGCGCASGSGSAPVWPAFFLFLGAFAALRRLTRPDA